MDIKDKIKKLLALANSPYEEEAKEAMLRARELMAKYKLEDVDIDQDRGGVEHHHLKDVKWTTDSGWMWVVNLVEAIAPNYCCAGAWVTPYRTRTHYLELTGFKDDLDVCEQVVRFAFNFVVGKRKYIERTSICPRDSFISYGKGFACGLEEAMAAQTEEHGEWGLVVSVPQEVKNYKDNLENKRVKAGAGRIDVDRYLEGLKDGRSFDPTNKIGHP